MKKKQDSVYSAVLALSIPIALQNIFTTAVSSADVFMVGCISQDALSAVSLAGQIQFVLNLIFLGLTLGTSLICAQYWGIRDMVTIEKILGLVIRIALGIAAVFAFGACVFSEQLMHLFTKEEQLITYGAIYLRIVGVSYLFMGISQVYLAVMKSVTQVRRSTIISSACLLLNILFNALLIFGWFGLPKLGVAGVAIGTLVSRLIEMVWCLIESAAGDKVKIRLSALLERNRKLMREFWKYAFPITLNGVSWGSAMATYSIIMGHLGSDVVAANSVATVVRNFAMVGCNGLASGAGIYLGNLLGNDKLSEAKHSATKVIKLILLVSLGGGILILLVSPVIPALVELSDQAQQYLRIMLYINAAYILAKAQNILLNNGILCAGGDTRFGLICDTVDMWCCFVPLGFICAFLLKLPPMAVYFVLCLDEVAKLPFMYRHYKKGKWIRNITI